MAGGGYPPHNPPPGGFQPPAGYPAPQQGHPAPYPNTAPGYGGYGLPVRAAPQPGAPYGIDPKTGIPFSDKQKIVGFVLQFFLGMFGAGRFYTGHTGIAIAQLAVSWLTCGIGSLWPTVDGVLMLLGKVTDSDGRPLRD